MKKNINLDRIVFRVYTIKVVKVALYGLNPNTQYFPVGKGFLIRGMEKVQNFNISSTFSPFLENQEWFESRL